MNMLPSPDTIAPNAMPTIAIVTSSSTSVNPWSAFRARPRITSTDARVLEHAVHRRDQRYCDEPDDRAHEQNDGRLEQRCEPLQLPLALTRGIAGGVFVLELERSGALSHPHLLHRGARQRLGLAERVGEPVALEHALLRREQLRLE